MKALIQSKEELEKCIKEQELINKDVSVPKTDDLVDEVNFLREINKDVSVPKTDDFVNEDLSFSIKIHFLCCLNPRSQPSKMKMAHYAQRLRCWRKKA